MENTTLFILPCISCMRKSHEKTRADLISSSFATGANAKQLHNVTMLKSFHHIGLGQKINFLLQLGSFLQRFDGDGNPAFVFKIRLTTIDHAWEYKRNGEV